MSETLNTIKQILELGWPAIVLVMLIIQYRAYEKRVDERFKAQDERIKYLEETLVNCLDGKI